MEQMYKYMVITVQQRKSFGFILMNLEMLICGLKRHSIPYTTTILSRRERLESGFIVSGIVVLQSFGEEKN